ncbi:MAG: acetate kinase [Coxiella sp. DG_40]|nr:MAG: acetate kinase [Coxiella sp. DG_40]
MHKTLIFVLNCGSSSIKFAVIDPLTEDNFFNGIVQSIGTKDADISWIEKRTKKSKGLPNINYQEALHYIFDLVNNKNLAAKILAIGHRVVHGGEHFTKSVIIDKTVLNAITKCQDLAPLHNPANILGIEIAKKVYPKLPQIAVFDTAFHQTMPKYAYLYAIPHELYTNHQIRKYGFHGTSHRYVSIKAAEILGKSLDECAFISAHLGNGCSICAILNGKSIDTSMGLTPLEGLVMGTRSGDIDPSLHIHLVDKLGYDIHKVNTMLNKKSGLLGVSGISSDMRAVENAAKKGNKQAIIAIEIFCYRLAKYIGAYATILGRIDALIFTAGIGENSSYIRAKSIKWLKMLNFSLDSKLNGNHGKGNNGIITSINSNIAIVIPTNEELMIAKDTAMLATKKQGGKI